MSSILQCFQKNLFTIILILLLTSVPVIKYWNSFSQPTNIDEYEKLYSNSQYVLGEASPQKIDDHTVYVYAGFTYVRGDDPTAVNFEHTPLAKYFLGLSYLLTGNSVLLNVPLYFFTLLLLYILSTRFIKNKLIIYAILISIGTMRLFTFNVSQGMLDIPNLFASLLFFVILTKTFKQKSLKYTLLGLSLGMFAGTRYPFPLILLLIIPLFVWSYGKKELKYSLISLLFLAITYFLSYIVYFQYHPASEFFKFEWYRFRWFTGDRTIPKFLIFQTIFIGKFKLWWTEGWGVVSTYTIMWPILFLTSILGTIKNKLSLSNTVILLYTYGLISFYAVAAANFDRFLIEIIPFWALVSGIGLENWKSKQTIFTKLDAIVKNSKHN